MLCMRISVQKILPNLGVFSFKIWTNVLEEGSLDGNFISVSLCRRPRKDRHELFRAIASISPTANHDWVKTSNLSLRRLRPRRLAQPNWFNRAEQTLLCDQPEDDPISINTEFPVISAIHRHGYRYPPPDLSSGNESACVFLSVLLLRSSLR